MDIPKTAILYLQTSRLKCLHFHQNFYFREMITIESFTFNPFQENTYVLSAENKDCYIIDPGCSNASEERILKEYIEENKLKPVGLIQTHCHIDHILGHRFIYDTWQLKPVIHPLELEVLQSGEQVGKMYGIPFSPGPGYDRYISEGDVLKLSDEAFEIIHAPGHSPGSICFYNKSGNFLIAGDVLFMESIGRTDLPGGNHQDLISSIKNKLFNLPEDCTVYPGHGPSTSIGHEKKYNPFLK